MLVLCDPRLIGKSYGRTFLDSLPPFARTRSLADVQRSSMTHVSATGILHMNLLAFELSTEACSVALWVDGDVRERHEIAPRRHAELALPWAEALLAEAGIAKSQLDAIAVGRGPGAFTGVRLGVAIAQGIALALDRHAVPVSTLAALAMRSVALGAAR